MEPDTSGLEDLLDWGDLEDLLEEGYFRTKRQVRAHVTALLAEQDETCDRRRWEEIKSGMWPEFRELYDALPDISPEECRELYANNVVLTEAEVAEIRSEHAAGATVTSLAERFGVGRSTMSNVVNRKTWRNAA